MMPNFTRKLNCLVYIGLQNKRGMNGAQSVVISQQKPNQIILKSWTRKYGALWTCCSPSEAKQLVNSDKGLYEILTKLSAESLF
jgi:hypothetical protein